MHDPATPLAPSTIESRSRSLRYLHHASHLFICFLLTALPLPLKQRDLNEIMADQMAEFEEELAITLADLQVKHTAILQKRVKGQLQKSLEHLNPTSISSSDWRPGFSEYRESPF